jgi:hypothetical protein
VNHRVVFSALCAGLTLAGCQKQGTLPQDNSALAAINIVDVSAAAGLNWSHNAGRSAHKYLPETVGGGGGFFDYDNDGDVDILLIDSGSLTDISKNKPNNKLYRNDGSGTFTDVTSDAGLTAITGIYGIGAVPGDFNQDGWTDILLTGVGHTILLENRKGHFIDVTHERDAAVNGFTTAAVFLDADRNGKTDIFVARYVEWNPKSDLPCGPAGKPQYCAPYQYKAAHPELLLQQANGRFRKADKSWGIGGNPGKTLAIAPYDFDKDGRLDLFLANDTEPDVLLMAGKDGRFKDMAIDAGVAVGINGSPTGSMGVDMVGDANNDHLAVGVFAGQQLSLFDASSAKGLQLFTNVQQASGVASATLLATTFGLVIGDINLDGKPDIVLANGHIDDDGMAVGSGQITYRQPLQVLSQRDDHTFSSWTPPDGALKSIVGRGLASGDIDNDGKLDLLVFENNGPVRLVRNDAPHQGPWLGIALKGRGGKSDVQGAMVTLSAGDWSVRKCVTPVRSYISLCDPRVLVSLPKGTRSVNVDVTWPDGKQTRQVVSKLSAYTTVSQP